jgi:hypothetical protein
MKKQHRKFLLLGIKCLIALALLAWVLSKVHLRDQIETLPDGHLTVIPGLITISRNIGWWLLACGAAGFVLSSLIVAVRWRLLLRIQGIFIGAWEAVRLTFLGSFFNYLVPGTVGGDLVKAYYVSQHTPKKAAVLLSVFVDRVMGLTELCLMAAAMIIVILVSGVESFSRIRLAAISIIVVFAAVAAILALLLSRALRRRLGLQRIYQRLPFARQISALGEAAVLYRQKIGELIRAILITFGAHIAWVGSIALLGASLSLEIPWYSYFLYVPLIYIIGSVPVSPGGVGIIENFYLIFFVSPLVGESRIFALSVLARLIPMFWAIPGAVVAITGPKVPKAEAIQAELGLGATQTPAG